MKPLRCEHGYTWGTCDNTWCENKWRIREKYAELSELGFLERITVRLWEPSTLCAESWSNQIGHFNQKFRVICYKGKEYFYKWGWGH